jgi:dipeptidyl aminopeptidase/acylaminoacyl peptidase
MPFRLVPAVALLGLLVGLSACAPAAAPTPQPTTPEGPRTLRTLIDADPESPQLELGAATDGDGFRIYEASYLSEGLTITGSVSVPDGPGPFPGVVAVHGAVSAATFTTGSDLVREQAGFARTGHIVFAPDLRGLGGSDPDPSGDLDLNVGQTADVVNAGRALAASGIPSLDADRIGLFGHSLGGAESMGAMVVAPDVYDVVATMAPASSRIWWVIDHFAPRDSPAYQALVDLYGTYEENPDYWDDVAAATFAERAAVPLLVMIGTADDPVFGVWAEHTVADWEAAGKDVTMVTVEGADHRMDPHWDAAFAQIVEFLDERLKP